MSLSEDKEKGMIILFQTLSMNNKVSSVVELYEIFY